MNEPAKQQSNPFSTGGGGGNFETRVQAAFTVLMLTGRVAPCLPAWPITKIKLQGRYAGFDTDDFIVFTQDFESKSEARLLAQLKHSISITEGNETLGEVILAAWNDFNNPSIFNASIDALALITGPLSATDINNTRTLLEWARHCEDEEEFMKKVSTSGFSNETKRSKLAAFRHHVSNANGESVSDEQLWRFLKCFHLLGYDLDTEAGGTISLLQSLLQLSTNENPSLLWASILDAVQTGNQNAGTITIGILPEEIKRAFNTAKHSQWDQDLKKFKAHGEYIIEGIRSDIGGVHINREEYIYKILEAAESGEFIFLTGERGCGKSNLIREFADYMKVRAPVFCLRTEDLDKSHLDHVFTGIGVASSLSELEMGFALMPKKYMFLESLEKLLELQNTAAFNDLIRFVQKNQGWTIIASGRDYAFQQITFNYLSTAGIKYSTLVIDNFKDDEIQSLCSSFEFLKPLANSRLLKNPFYAELAYRAVLSGARFSSGDSEREFKQVVWKDVISKEQIRINGMPLKRRKTFVDIAVNRAKKMAYGVPDTNYDYDALLKLEEDNLIRRDTESGLVSLTHDILEDWGLERFINETHQANLTSTREFLKAVGHEPAMNRAFRLWLHSELRFNDNVSPLIHSILNDKEIESCWKDETISAVLLGKNPYEFLSILKEQLFENNGELLKRFCFVLRISCKTPNQNLIQQFPEELSKGLNWIFLKPYGAGWEDLIRFLCENRESLKEEFIPHLTLVLKEWLAINHIDKVLPSYSREAGLLAIHLLYMLKDSYREEENRTKLLEVIISVVPSILDEFNLLLDNDVFVEVEEHRRPYYVEELCSLSLNSIQSIYLCKHIPDTVIKLAYFEWIINDNRSERNHRYFRKEVAECFGLDDFKTKSDFNPASGAKGPFIHLFRFHPWKGLDFVIELLNKCAEKYAKSDLDSDSDHKDMYLASYVSEVEEIEIVLAEGTVIKQYSSQRLWNAYRGHSVVPDLLQSALMALENLLIDYLESPHLKTETIEQIYNYILSNSNSVMPTAVLASMAVGYPDKLARVAFSLLKVAKLYDLDLTRSIHERGERELNWHALSPNPLREYYSKERQKAALRRWRSEHLETLITRLQFTEQKIEVLNIIDYLRSQVSGEDDTWQFRFHRIDSRLWEATVDENQGRIVFSSKALEPHLEKIQNETEAEREMISRFMTISVWSEKLLNYEALEHEYYSDWGAALSEAKNLYEVMKNNKTNEISRMYFGAITKAATIFIRDHHFEMNENDLSWCLELISQVLCSGQDDNNSDKLDYNGVGAAAKVLPILLDITESEDEKKIVKQMIAYSLTHISSAVRIAASYGINKFLWNRDSSFAEQCILGAIEYAKLMTKKMLTSRFYSWKSNNEENQNDVNEVSLFEILQEQIVDGTVSTDIESITFSTHDPSCLLSPCLMIPNNSTEPQHVLLFSKMLTLLIEAEGLERENRYGSNKEHSIDIHYELPMNFAERLATYFINTFDLNLSLFVEELVKGCDVAPKIVGKLLLHIEYCTEKLEMLELYWKLWKELSPKAQSIALDLSQKYDHGHGYSRDDWTKLIRDMLHADVPWQKSDYKSQSIALGKEAILEFVGNSGGNLDVFEAMTSLMHHFPDVFLESGLLMLSKHQANIGGTKLFSGVNTTFYLIRCIQRFLLIDKTGTISNEMYSACWILLDGIVETASSEAYFLREHLIRSRRISNSNVSL